jgi:LuxR family maltose regulon positive regulatory protein
LLCGDPEHARARFSETVELATRAGATFAAVVAHAELALLALVDDQVSEAEAQLEQAWRLAASAPVGDYVPTAILLAASARHAIRQGDTERANGLLASAQVLRPMLTHQIGWFSVQTLVELARVHLALADADGAQALLRDARSVARLRPGLGVIVEQLAELAAQVASFSGPRAGWASTLTTAELRLLPLLTTHLTFREIAERLHVSRNTVKTQAISVYRKLDASSRSEAIDRARALGLVDAPVGALQ